MYISNYRRRSEAVFLFFLIFLLACIIRLFYIQFFRSGFLREIAAKQHTLLVELEPLRGTIFDANHKPQAINLSSDSLYACPNEMKVEDKNRALLHLPKILDCSSEFVRQRIFRKKSFIWIARKISWSC